MYRDVYNLNPAIVYEKKTQTIHLYKPNHI